MGTLIGGFIWSYIFGWLIGRFFWKETRPEERARNAMSAGYGLACVIGVSSYNSALPILLYAPGAIGAYLLLVKDYRKAWIPDDSTFD